jgi:predicted DNA-binding transcriptional regulator AlpA
MKTGQKRIGPNSNRPDNLGDESLLAQLAAAIADGQRDKVFDLAVAFLKDADPEYLSLQEVSQRLTISERSVWRLVARGELRGPVHIGSSCRWLSKDVREYQTRIETKRPKICR